MVKEVVIGRKKGNYFVGRTKTTG